MTTLIVINISDTNLGFTINDTKWYIHEYNRMLTESDIYTFQQGASKNDIICDSLQRLYGVAANLNRMI